MAKGTESKTNIFNKILEVFPGSFMQDDKILRIPMQENGETVEIKVTLTAAKDIIGAAAPAQKEAGSFDWSDSTPVPSEGPAAAPDLTEDEKERIKRLMEAIGMS